MLTLRKHVSPYNTRRRETWFIPRCNTSYNPQSLLFYISCLLNKYCLRNTLPNTPSNKQIVLDFVDNVGNSPSNCPI